MANESDRHVVFLEILFFKRKHNKQMLYVLLHGVDPVFFPGPHLRCYVVKNGDAIFMCPFCNAQIKAGIVNENQRIGTKCCDVFLTESNVSEDGFYVDEHFIKSHEGQIAVVFYYICACALHKITAPGTNIQGRPVCFESLDEIATVQISRCLTGYDIQLQADCFLIKPSDYGDRNYQNNDKPFAKLFVASSNQEEEKDDIKEHRK